MKIAINYLKKGVRDCEEILRYARNKYGYDSKHPGIKEIEDKKEELQKAIKILEGDN